MKIAAVIDFFIHPVHFKKPDQLRRARLFVRANLLTSLFSNTYIWLSLLFGYERGVYLMIFNVIGFLALPFLAKTKLPISWLGNLYIFIGASAVVILTYYSGGMWSAIYPWMASIPILALLVVNRFSGGVWGAISFTIMLWFGALAYQGVELPVEYNTEMRTIWYITVLPGPLLIVLFIAFVFESIQSTALKRLESKNELLQSQKETIVLQSNELRKHIDEKDYIIRILAHDLNNPLSNITSLVALLEGNNDVEHQEKYIKMIKQSSSNAQNLIRRVIEMDVSNQENLNVQLELLDLSTTVNEVLKLMKASASKKQISIEVIDGSLKKEIQADRTYLSLIFENLISNAIKFSPKGKRVQVAISNTESSVQVKVMDEGPGIDKREEDKLFKKFSKLSARPTGGESSTGLGLSLVKRYVELSGGKVWYERRNEGGAAFAVEFPLST